VLSVPLGVQATRSQELPTWAKEHKERSKEKNRKSKKFNKKEFF